MTDPNAPTGGWHDAVVREVIHPHAGSVILRLDVPNRTNHWPGQHYVVRLRAEDGYTAQRSYSIASAPSDPLIELYVERLDDGEVSTHLADVLAPGDELEVRGPIGGWFVWTADAPAVGVAGGSGVVPLIAMLRHAIDQGRQSLLRLAVSARTFETLPYADELVAAGALIAITREHAPSGRRAARLTGDELASLLVDDPTCFVCGSTRFASATTDLLTSLGVDSARIRVEQFGPSS